MDASTCKSRRLSRGVDWCSGDEAPLGSGSRVMRHPRDDEAQLETEVECFNPYELVSMLTLIVSMLSNSRVVAL